MMAPHRNHVEARASRRPARQYVSDTHDHKPDAPGAGLLFDTLSHEQRRALADIVYRGGIDRLPCGWDGTWTYRDSTIMALVDRRLCHKEFCLAALKWIVNATPLGRDAVFEKCPDAAALSAAIARGFP